MNGSASAFPSAGASLQRSSSPPPQLSLLKIRSFYRRNSHAHEGLGFDSLGSLGLSRTDTEFSTSSESRRGYSLKSRFQSFIGRWNQNYQQPQSSSLLLVGRHFQPPRSNSITLRSLPGSYSAPTSPSRRPHSPLASHITTPTTAYDHETSISYGLTARQFASIAQMKVLYASDLDEERTTKSNSILDPEFFSPPSPTPSTSQPQPTLNRIPSAETVKSDLTLSSSPPKMKEVTVANNVTEQPVQQSRPSTSSNVSDSTVSMHPLPPETQYVKIGRFLVSYSEPQQSTSESSQR
ncbi:hypothetical protein HK098_000080 [Nowakowskiella sp. JEL0407]|nr:hypothetical protein HK098_000080 [Nowakowskiella sp. JEL0407]